MGSLPLTVDTPCPRRYPPITETALSLSAALTVALTVAVVEPLLTRC